MAQIGAVAAVLVVLPNTAFELDRFLIPKELTLHLTAVLAGLLAFGAIRRTIGTRVDLLLITYLGLSALSALMATNRWLALRALAISASGLLLFWTARGLRDAGLGLPLLNGLAFAVVIAAVMSLLQAYGLHTELFASSRAPGGTLGNRNFVAHAAAFGLPLCFLAAIRAQRTIGYLTASIGVAILSASLVLSRSRAAWLATAVMLLTFIVFARTWTRLTGVLLFAAGGVAAALLIPNTLRWRSENPYLETARRLANYEEGSGRGRLVQYRRSLLMAARYPLLGVGPGNWPVVYPAHSARNDPSMNESEPGMTFNPWPSSDWISFVAERGLAAAVVIALAFLGIAGAGFRSPDHLLAATLLAILAAVVVEGLFDAVLLLAVPTLIVWTAFGALLPPPSAVRGPRLAFVLIVLAISAMGVARSTAQLVAMEMYVTHRSSLERASQIDPGNYRIHLRLAQRCEHARAAHTLFPNAEEARSLSRRCGR